MAKESKEGLTVKKEEDFSEWYTQVVIKSEFIDYSLVSGCVVFRPLSYAVWEKVKDVVDRGIKLLGVKNAYFPLLIPENLLNKEATHLKGFSPEVAWVTQTGDTKLSERLAIRPTSETIMYDSYSKWIRSWRDLPLKLNQWNSVLRWEFKHPVPLLRSREFLWNEGHTAFASKEEAEQEIKDMISLWKDVGENYLALYGIPCRKTESEKFAGAEYTIAFEYLLPNGKIIQGQDVHHDGQIFAKAYNIKFVDKDDKTKYVYQNTWAISTRMIGAMVSIHSDNKGLIIPPKLAENKIVIIPIIFEDSKKKVFAKCKEVEKKLEKFNAKFDDREDCTPGWKFNEWELKGIPLRIEIGPKDLEKDQVVLVRRDDFKKEFIKLKEIEKKVQESLDDIQKNLFNNHKKFVKDNMVSAKNIDEIGKAIKDKKFIESYWCGSEKCEKMVREKTEGVINLPLEQTKSFGKCVACEKQGKHNILIAKSY